MLIAQVVNGIVNDAAHRLALPRLQTELDFHAPGWRDAGDLEFDGFAVATQIGCSDLQRMLVVVFGSVIPSPPERPDLDLVVVRVGRTFAGDFIGQRQPHATLRGLKLDR